MIVANLTSTALLEGDLIIRIDEKSGKFGPYPAFTVERRDDPRIEAALEILKEAHA